MTEATAPPEPIYSLRPVWTAAIAYLLNLVVVVALAARLSGPTVGADDHGATYLGAFAGLAAGALLWGWTTRFRTTGLVAWASPFLVVVSLVVCATSSRSPTLSALAGFLACVGFIAAYWYVGSFSGRGLPFAVQTRIKIPKLVALVATVIASGFVVYSTVDPPEVAEKTYWFIALAASILLALWSCATLYRAATEIFFEMPLTVAYAIRRGGPGLYEIPSVGPVLVIGNHACWFDPLFVSKALPRPGTPMMTARFYSIWFLRPLLKYIFRVIVVPESPMRREAPELKLAIAALDRGECVMLFPEGYLRRKEEMPLRRFGQGVWQILKERPDTPVVACWVEGGWGAWCSYFNGPPTKNKRMDFRRKIVVGVSVAEPVPAELLGDHLRTRVYLMNRVRAVRVTLGLPDLPAVELPPRGEADETGE